MKYVNAGIVSAMMVFSSSSVAKQEGWYTMWSIGGGTKALADEHQVSLEDNNAIIADIWGFYWPLSSNSILGVVGTGSSNLNQNGTTNEGNSVSTESTDSIMGLSYINFYGNEIGDGLFFRGDLGFANSTTRNTDFSLQIETDSFITKFESTEINSSGLGFVLGGGYGIPISDETRILLGFNLRHVETDLVSSSSYGFTIGGLW